MKSIRKIHLFLIIIIPTILSFNLSNTWYLLESKACGYKIEFPQKPTESPQVVDSELGKLKMNIFMYDASSNGKDENMMYMINYTEYPISRVNSDNKQQLATIYRNSIDAAVKNVNGKLLSEKSIVLKGFVGKEIKVDLKEDHAVINMRVYLVKNKMYMIQVFTDVKKDSNQSIIHFMNSFNLL